MNSSAYVVNLSFDGFLSKEMSSTLLGPKCNGHSEKMRQGKRGKMTPSKLTGNSLGIPTQR